MLTVAGLSAKEWMHNRYCIECELCGSLVKNVFIIDNWNIFMDPILYKVGR